MDSPENFNKLDHDLRIIAHKKGADFYGVADLSPAHDFIRDQGGDEVASYPLGISLGIRIMDSIVDELPHRKERSVAVNYRHHGYQVINRRLDFLASCLGSYIQNAGYHALPLPASERYDDERICAVFSHKLTAHLAGHGWIGKSCMLITPEAGPRVRWITILTDAPLRVTGTPMDEKCGNCTECVEICPVSSFTGTSFQEDEPRKTRYDARKCEKYLNEGEEWSVCGLCIYICPHRRK
ncbi:4Fe-4S double cluster binding domain-containing protein [Methanobacterium petrolearium]|uniref:4Fe-4S double cluster binding domain-containing protein n=1 Tax=Methanobacterium petrolearium TaxID=710190 RepID=UPI001AE3ACC8|nr:4Fe-4S double cluster binding domain-containing protein [Methanobacterium petrolearium]MBP1946570.1 epoxyqueuosine reductase QueG [Methanobacterium petrolearium]BDZ69918.1 iron-sulfur-binding protein [Methanobacterium petrolearium]